MSYSLWESFVQFQFYPICILRFSQTENPSTCNFLKFVRFTRWRKHKIKKKGNEIFNAINLSIRCEIVFKKKRKKRKRTDGDLDFLWRLVCPQSAGKSDSDIFEIEGRVRGEVTHIDHKSLRKTNLKGKII